MNKTTSIAVLIAAFLLTNSSTALAQDPTGKAFVDINGGAQPQARTLHTSASVPLYDETAIVNAAQGIDGGGLFDVSGGYRIRPGLAIVAIGVGFSFFSKSGEGSFIALIPDPLTRNRPTTATASTSGLKRREIGTHLMAFWSVPFFEKIDATIFAGPSFFQLSQDVMTVTAGTPTANAAAQREKANAPGGNVGINLNYMLAPRSGSRLQYGFGIVLRYAGASADLPSAENVGVGGFQVGGGLRLRF